MPVTRSQMIESVTGKKTVEGGQGDEGEMRANFLDWIGRVEAAAKKAKREMKSKGSPGRDTSEFVGMVVRSGEEDWYDFYWG